MKKEMLAREYAGCNTCNAKEICEDTGNRCSCYKLIIALESFKESIAKDLVNKACQWWEGNNPKSVINYQDCVDFRKYMEEQIS